MLWCAPAPGMQIGTYGRARPEGALARLKRSVADNPIAQQLLIPRLLKPWQRVIACLTGAAALGGGTTAVFVTKSSTGAAVLLIVGAVVGLIGLLGIVPIRMRVGSVEIETALIQAMASPDPVVKETAADIVIESSNMNRLMGASSSGTPQSAIVARQLADSVVAEREMTERAYLDIVLKTLDQVGAHHRIHVPGLDQRFDAIVEYKGKHVAIEAAILNSTVRYKQTINRLLSTLGTSSWSRDIDGILLVTTRTGAIPMAEGAPLGQPLLRVALFDASDDKSVLQHEMDILISNMAPE